MTAHIGAHLESQFLQPRCNQRRRLRLVARNLGMHVNVPADVDEIRSDRRGFGSNAGSQRGRLCRRREPRAERRKHHSRDKKQQPRERDRS